MLTHNLSGRGVPRVGPLRAVAGELGSALTVRAWKCAVGVPWEKPAVTQSLPCWLPRRPPMVQAPGRRLVPSFQDKAHSASMCVQRQRCATN
jgi:hypothetical protein